MNILYITSEAAPFCKTGGLADVLGSLPPAMAAEGDRVSVLLPLYGQIAQRWREKMNYRGYIYVDLGWRHEYCGLFSLEYRGVTWYFVDNERYFRRRSLYGDMDDGERFAFFSKAAEALLPHLAEYPNVIHCNDWQTALVPVYLRDAGNDLPVVFTIHNIEYQGKYGPETVEDLFGLNRGWYDGGILRMDGCVNLMKAAMLTANAVTTVSSVCRALGLDADDVSQGVIEKLSSAQDSLRTLEETLTAMQTLADQTDSILACAGVVTGDLDSIVSGNDLSGIQDALDRGIGRLNETEAEIARQLEDIDAQIDVIADDIAAAVGTAEDVAGFLAGPAQQLDQRLAEQQQRLEKLRDFAAGYPAVQERLGNAIYRIGELRDLLKTLENPGQLETWRQEVQAKVDELRQELREAALRISGSVNQRLEELNRDVTEKLQTLQSVFDSVSGNLSALGDKLTRYQEAIQSTGTTLSGAIQLSSTLRGDLGQLAQDMDRIVTSDGFRRFVEVLENDPEGLADYLSDPVSMETVPVYEITSYGSSMAPYYIMLALFVGSLLTATMLHVNAPMPELFRLRPWQRFFGRYQLFFLIGMIQALVTGLGCIYYIGIQCPYPGLFLLACCVCSLNFTMMNYALVYALDNIGMAASVIIMVIQVAGSGGVYPIDVLPGIFQTLYKFMPFHYGMDMLRETIAGRYENVYWKNLAVMAAMCVLFAVLGMVLYYPARPLNRLIARSKEKSGIM